jgi:hypothetical protein
MPSSAAESEKTAGKKSTSRRRKDIRASGKTAGQEEAERAAKEVDQPIAPELPDEQRKKFRTPGFTRMRFTWLDPEYAIVKRAIDIAEGRIVETFSDMYELMNEIYDYVRTPEVDDETGEILADAYGFRVWKRTPLGAYEEDFSRLTVRQKHDLIFKITTRLFDWEQRAANLWLEAMMSKVRWEEAHGTAFDEPMAGTIDDRTAYANRQVSEDKYFAIFLTTISRRADALVNTMQLLGQRIKDSLEV